MYMQVIRISVYNNAALSWGCIIRITNKVQSSVQYLFALFIEKKNSSLFHNSIWFMLQIYTCF